MFSRNTYPTVPGRLVAHLCARQIPQLALITIALLAFTSCSIGNSPKLPEFSNHLVDPGNKVPDDVEQQINDELSDYQTRSTNQIAVLVTDTTGSQSIEDYAVDLGNKWGVGTKDSDNGVLMIIALDDRKARVEVGYGLQEELTDVRANKILETNVFPQLRNENTGQAVMDGQRAIRAVLGDETVSAPQSSPNASDNTDGPWWLPLVFFAFFIPIFAIGFFQRRRHGFDNAGWATWGAGTLGGGGFGGGSGGWGGGGFGGGGGGGFGGGGSSGSW